MSERSRALLCYVNVSCTGCSGGCDPITPVEAPLATTNLRKATRRHCRRDECAAPQYLTEPLRHATAADLRVRRRHGAHAAAVAANLPWLRDPVNGLTVFTARFLAERGYCCSSGCRHCPYVQDGHG